MHPFLAILVMISPVFVVPAFADGKQEDSPVQAIKQIVSRALPAIRDAGAEWIAEKDCLSCHRVGLQVWALNRAAEAGFQSDEHELGELNRWATTWQNMVAPKRRKEATMEKILTRESDTVTQLLLGRAASIEKTESDWIKTYRSYLIRGQRDSGSWKPAGQLPQQKRPKRETEEVTTMWALLGLFDSGLPRSEFESSLHKSQDWLGNETEAKSSEWWATRLLVERAIGSNALAQQRKEKLLKHQNEDGGWGWLINEESDALGTGIVLYALARDRDGLDPAVIKKAITFLKASQEKDGSWKVRGTKENSRDRITETASYWGTCWAVIGLLELMDLASNNA